MTSEDGDATTYPISDSPANISSREVPDPADQKSIAAEARSRRSAQAAAVVFGAYLVVAFFLIVFKYGSEFWFAGDEWGFIIDRKLSDPASLFRPQQTHWSTVPIVVYQVLFKIFGLDTYLPYQILVAALHLTLATLIRVIMRRAGVGPWVATVVAGTFVLFGAGHQNITWGIQISMVGSMVLGFTHLILADHDGPFDRRDALGLAAGAIGLMASGIAPPLVVVVGVAVFIRRGWLMAAVHTAPLAALYGLWWFTFRSDLDEQTSAARFTYDVISSWVATGETGVFLALGHYRIVAIALAVVLVSGLALAWGPLSFAELRRKMASPTALLIGALLLFALVGTQRAVFGPGFARSSRYLSMGAALTLPALAVAANAIIQRWRLTAPVVLGLFLVGIWPNQSKFYDPAFSSAFFANQRQFVLGVANSPLLDVVDADVQPDPSYLRADTVTVGFLRNHRDAGRTPDPGPLPPAVQDAVDTRLLIAQSRETVPTSFQCRAFLSPIAVVASDGEVFGIGDDVIITLTPEGRERRSGVRYQIVSGPHLEVQAPEVRFEVTAGQPGTSFDWCQVD